MITILSPAKTIEESPEKKYTELRDPLFIKEANYLAGLLKKSSAPRLMKLMNVSRDLAELNQERYFTWEQDSGKWKDLPALLAFKGEVFRGAGAWEWTDKQLEYAREHIIILSGLFGILYPDVKIRPYRLEIGTGLKNRMGPDLYSFWKKRLTKAFEGIIAEEGSGIIVNLASNEYFKAIDWKKLNIRIITPTFKDFHNGSYKFLTVYGKHARGMMARFINTNQLQDPEDIKAFDEGGYVYNPRMSEGDDWVFTRG